MSALSNIFLKIAAKLGYKLQPKTAVDDDYSKIDDISLTAVVANRIATQAMLDSALMVRGDNARAKYQNWFSQEFREIRMSVGAEICVGTGDCLVKPYTDGKRIGVDIIKNGNFVVCDSIGDFIKSCIIKADEIKDKSGDIFTRFEAQSLKEDEAGNTHVLIEQFAFKNEKEIPLNSVPAWAEINETTIIPNVDKLLFGRYKCPTVNRQNINGTEGVKITYGLDKVMKNAVDAYDRFNEEYNKKEAFLFVDKSILKKKGNGQDDYVVPKGKERVFQIMRGVADEKSSNKIQEYSPDIRDTSFQNGIETNFRALELFMGLSSGVLTTPITSYATATEVRASMHATKAFVKKLQLVLQNGTKDLLEAVDALLNINNITPMGEWELTFRWSNELFDNMTEYFSNMIQGEAIGAVSTAEVRAWLLNEEIEEAKKKVAENAEQFARGD